ncbi:hypothetical protein T281_00850 [Rhodomicrobium udaipurense JA643]|nr:hypothetical protein T281_00850 [Rhodomicrobium udaipurense JA643]
MEAGVHDRLAPILAKKWRRFRDSQNEFFSTFPNSKSRAGEAFDWRKRSHMRIEWIPTLTSTARYADEAARQAAWPREMRRKRRAEELSRCRFHRRLA